MKVKQDNSSILVYINKQIDLMGKCPTRIQNWFEILFFFLTYFFHFYFDVVCYLSVDEKHSCQWECGRQTNVII